MSMIIEQTFFLKENLSYNRLQTKLFKVYSEDGNKTPFDFVQEIKIKGLQKIKENSLKQNQKLNKQIHLFEFPNLQQKIVPILHLKFSKLESLVHYNAHFYYKQIILKVETSQQRLWVIHKLSKINQKLNGNITIIVQMNTGKIKITYKSPKYGKQYDQFSFLQKSICLDIKIILKAFQSNRNFINKILIPNYKDSNPQNEKILKIQQYLNISHLDFSFSTKLEQCSYNFLQAQKRKQILFKNLQQSIDSTYQFEQNNLYQIVPLKQRVIPTQNQFQAMQQGQFGKYLSLPQPTNIGKGQNKYICNQIKISDIQNCSQFFKPKEGGVSKMNIFKVKYVYVFSYTSQDKQKEEHQIQSKNQKFLIKYLAEKVPKHLQKSLEIYQMRKIQHEKQIIKQLKGGASAFLPKYYIQNNNKFQKLYMDYFAYNLNLGQFLQISQNSLSIYSKIHLLINISNSLRFIKNYQIVHMDLNPFNIIVYNDFIVKLIDFGESYHQKVCTQDYNPGYTLPFCPPQVFKKQKIFTSAQDIFSFGIVSFLMMTNQFPFYPSQELLQTFKKKTYHERIMYAPQKFSDLKIKQISLIMLLFFKCIRQNQEFRPIPTWLTILLKQIYFI